MDFTSVIRNRYSCKKYQSKPVPEEVLQAILEAGQAAPTAKNLQEQLIYVISSPENLAVIDRNTPCRYGAPMVLAVAYDERSQYIYPGERYQSGAEDVTIVATHMMLAAANAGVNSCWLNRFDPDQLAKDLKLPEYAKIVMLLDLGYAAEGSGPLPNHVSRKNLAETVKRI